jgi:hypothetical protein
LPVDGVEVLGARESMAALHCVTKPLCDQTPV